MEIIVNAQVALKQYGNVKVNAAVTSASPHELIVMLFDGLLERIAQMRGAIEQGNIELKNHKVNQAVSILFGLRESLNQEQGADLSARLDELYDYIQRQLWKAHIKNDPEILDECTALTTEISSAWNAIALEIAL